MTGPSGMTSELAYDASSNPISIASESIPGSGDPNVLLEMGYCS